MRVALTELLGQIVPGTSIFAWGSVDTPSVRPFVVCRFGLATPAFKAVGDRRALIWVHDEGNDYTRIDDTISSIKLVMTEVTHWLGSDGSHISQASWEGDSEDLVDDGHNTITKNTAYTLLGA